MCPRRSDFFLQGSLSGLTLDDMFSNLIEIWRLNDSSWPFCWHWSQISKASFYISSLFIEIFEFDPFHWKVFSQSRKGHVTWYGYQNQKDPLLFEMGHFRVGHYKADMSHRLWPPNHWRLTLWSYTSEVHSYVVITYLTDVIVLQCILYPSVGIELYFGLIYKILLFPLTDPFH